MTGKHSSCFEPFQWDKEDNGIFFDDSFHRVGTGPECDNYVFRFGDVWYYLKKGDENKVKLNRLQYIGKANLFDESLRFDTYIGVHGNFELMNGSTLLFRLGRKSEIFRNKSAWYMRKEYACISVQVSECVSKK